MTLIGTGAEINRQLFGSTDAYLLDVGHTVFAFIGIDASKQERSAAMRHAVQVCRLVLRSPVCSGELLLLVVGIRVFFCLGLWELLTNTRHTSQYLEENNRPMHTPITRVLEGGATTAFDRVFA